MADYYKTLDIQRDADEKAIRSAFRKLARQYHPDLNKDDPDAEARFKEVNEAYEVLSDPDSRKKYDVYGDRWKDADRIEEQRRASSSVFDFGGGYGRYQAEPVFDFDHLWGGMGGFREFESRSRNRRPSTVRTETSITISLDEAYRGTTVNATLTQSGRERRFEVDIPPGVDSGSVVRVKPESGTELLFRVSVKLDARFTRKGADLYADAEVPFEDAILGGETEVRTLDGRRISVEIPENSQNGQNIRLRGLGMPDLDAPETRGDLYVKIRPAMPKTLTDEQRDLITRFRESRGGG